MAGDECNRVGQRRLYLLRQRLLSGLSSFLRNIGVRIYISILFPRCYTYKLLELSENNSGRDFGGVSARRFMTEDYTLFLA